MRKPFYILIITILLLGCKKNEAETYTQSATDAALAEQLTVDSIKEILLKGPDYVVRKEYTGIDGLIVTSDPLIETDVYPKEITFIYGSGITGPQGSQRKGSLIFTIQSGTVKTSDIVVSFEDFSINGSEILGEIAYVYNASKNGYDGEYLTEGISIVNGNGTMKVDGIFSLERLSTSGTLEAEDDLYNYSCNISGFDFQRTSFTNVSLEDHTIDLACPDYIISGTSTITPNEKGDQTLNFGGGSCDATAILTSGEGAVKNISF